MRVSKCKAIMIGGTSIRSLTYLQRSASPVQFHGTWMGATVVNGENFQRHKPRVQARHGKIWDL